MDCSPPGSSVHENSPGDRPNPGIATPFLLRDSVRVPATIVYKGWKNTMIFCGSGEATENGKEFCQETEKKRHFKAKEI